MSEFFCILARCPDEARAYKRKLKGLSYRASHGDSPCFAIYADARVQVRTDDSSGLAIVADCRLDNRGELLNLLGKDSSPALTDATLLLLSYQRWGPGFESRVYGDYSFAIWDGPRQQLCLGRDTFGVKPLFFHHTDQFTLVATRLATLVALEVFKPTVDEDFLIRYLAELPLSAEGTAYRQVARVPPASTWLANRGRTRLLRHWHPERVPEFRSGRPQDHVALLASELRRAVQTRAVASRRSAVLLSGGLDSSSITALLSEEQKRHGELLTVSAAFPYSPQHDELRYQRAVVEHCGCRHIRVDIESTALTRNIDQTLALLAEPTLVGGHWLIEPLMLRARDLGADLLFTGVDGDRIISHGVGYPAELAKTNPCELLRTARTQRRGALRATRLLLGQLGVAHLPKVAVNAFDTARSGYRYLRSPGRRYLRLERLHQVSAWDHLRDAGKRVTSAREAHIAALTRYDCSHDVELCAALGAELGVEFRHPFYDRRLAETCLAMPGWMKQHDGVTRWGLRKAMEKSLPKLICNRQDKTSFDAPFERWSRGQLEGGSLAFKHLEPYLEVQRLGSEKIPHDFLWRCAVADRWLDRFF